jgi:diacylglycerol kinase (ATP)
LSSPKPGAADLGRILRALGFSLQGVRAVWRHEAAFRQEALVAIVLVPLGLWLGADGVERALLVGSWLLVMIVELLNSAIEALVDRIGTQPHELSGRAKDVGSAAVLVAIALAVLVWLLVLTK